MAAGLGGDGGAAVQQRLVRDLMRTDQTPYGIRLSAASGSSPQAQPGRDWRPQEFRPVGGTWGVNVIRVRDRDDLGMFATNVPLAAEARMFEDLWRSVPPSFVQRVLMEPNLDARTQLIRRFQEESALALATANTQGGLRFDFSRAMRGGSYAYRIGFLAELDRSSFRLADLLDEVEPNTVERMSFWTQWTGYDLAAEAAARMLNVGANGVRQLRVVRAPFVPMAQSDVATDRTALQMLSGSDVRITRIVWATLMVYDLRTLLIGNGVMVNQLRRAFFSPLHLPGIRGVPLDLLESRDCLFNALALSASLQTPACDNDALCFYQTVTDRHAIELAGMRVKTRIYAEARRHDVRGFDFRLQRPGERLDIKVFVEHCCPRWSVLVVNRDCEPLQRIVSKEARRAGDCTGKELVLMWHENHYSCLLPFASLVDSPKVPSLTATSSSARREQVRKVREFVRTIKEAQRIALRRPGMTRRATDVGLQAATAKYNESVPSLVWPRKGHDAMADKVGYVDLETEQRPYDPYAAAGFGEDPPLHEPPFDENASSSLTTMDTAPREQLPIICVWTMLDEATVYDGDLPRLSAADVHFDLGYECVHRFFSHLEQTQELNGYTFYAHNGGRFDYILLMRALLQPPTSGRFVLDKIMPRGGGFLAMSVRRCRDNAKVWFLDTFYHLSASLTKLCRDFDPPHYKQAGAVDYDSLTLAKLRADPALLASWRDYAEHDILSLAEIWESYRRTIYRKYGVDVTRHVFTSATLAKTVYLSQYYDSRTMPIFSLGHDCEEAVRRSYSGGRCEVICHRYDVDPTDPMDGVFYVDFTSLYPYEMCKNLPYGKPRRVRTSLADIREARFFGFVTVRVRTALDAVPDTDVPYLCVTASDADNGSGSKLVFGVFPEYTELVLFSEEIVYILEEGLPYEFASAVDLDGWLFCRGPLLRDISTEMFARKRDAPTSTERRVAKITVNSLYGVWGMRRLRDALEVISVEDAAQAEQLAGAITEGRFSHMFLSNGAFVGRTMAFADSNSIVPSIAAAVTAYARTTLHKLMHKIRKHGGKLLYCDTDSVITNLNVLEHPDFQSMMGKHLGGLTNELDGWPNGRATSFVALGPKMYGLASDEGTRKTKTAHKGFKSVGYDDMLRMWEEREAAPPIVETQLQFRFHRASLYTAAGTSSSAGNEMPVARHPENMPVSLRRMDVERSVGWEALQRQCKRRRVETDDKRQGETEPPRVFAASGDGGGYTFTFGGAASVSAS